MRREKLKKLNNIKKQETKNQSNSVSFKHYQLHHSPTSSRWARLDLTKLSEHNTLNLIPDIANNNVPEIALKKHAEQMSLVSLSEQHDIYWWATTSWILGCWHLLVSHHFLDSGLLLGILGGNRCQIYVCVETLCLTIQSAHELPIQGPQSVVGQNTNGFMKVKSEEKQQKYSDFRESG